MRYIIVIKDSQSLEVEEFDSLGDALEEFDRLNFVFHNSLTKTITLIKKERDCEPSNN